MKNVSSMHLLFAVALAGLLAAGCAQKPTPSAAAVALAPTAPSQTPAPTVKKQAVSQGSASAAAQQAKQDVDEVFERLEALDPATVAGLVACTADERSTAERARQPVADRAGRLRLDIEMVERDLQQAADAAASWSGRPAAAIEAECISAQTAVEEARTRAALARKRQEEAAAHLTAVRLGQAPPLPGPTPPPPQASPRGPGHPGGGVKVAVLARLANHSSGKITRAPERAER